MEVCETILAHIRGGIILCNYDTKKGASKVVYINAGWTEITGYTAQELMLEKSGNPLALVLPADQAETDAQYRQQMLSGNTYELLYRIIHKSGDIRWVVDKGLVTPLPNGILQNQSIVTEITAIKEREKELLLLAQIDQLTNLNNKATFTILAKNTFNRHRERCHALLLLDIDDFKGFNDSYGHAFGDKVLEGVATQMKELFRSRDILGRMGGDEFLILMTDVQGSESVEKEANELRHAIRGMKISGANHAPVTVSIGGALFREGTSYEALFNEADAALYRAKGNGKNQYVQITNAIEVVGKGYIKESM